jgi:hypothetical protein
MDVEDQIVHNYPSCRKTMKWTKKFTLFLVQIATLDSSILFNNTSQTKIERARAMLSMTSYLTVFRK